MVFAARQQQTIPLTIERVRKIKSLNRQNIVPEELEAVEVVSTKPKEVEPAFVDVVGQISLRSLERADKKRKQQRRSGPSQASQAANANQGAAQQGQQQKQGQSRGGNNRPQQQRNTGNKPQHQNQPRKRENNNKQGN